MSLKNWDFLGEFLQKEAARPQKLMRFELLSLAEQGVMPLLEHLFAEEERVRKTVDNMAFSRARDMGFEEPEDLGLPLCEWWYQQRVMCAADSMGLLLHEGGKEPIRRTPPSAWTRAELIDWAMQHAWLRRYDHWLKVSAISFVHQQPLYGWRKS